jgi:hypothetical protein
MDSKTELSESLDTDAAPPSYSETITSPYHPSASTSQYYSSQIQTQLQDLATQVSTLKTQQTLLAHAKDEKILSILTPHIQSYLSDFAKTGLQKGTLILVPSAAVEDQKALPTDYDFRSPEEYDRVVRVRDKETDEYGKDTWFWRDEDMAKRLAGFLRPPPNPKTTELPPRVEEVTTQASASPSTSRGFWGRRKSSKSVPQKALPDEKTSSSKETEQSKASADNVTMRVIPEEVCFRTENAFGMYGTESGWGILVKLQVTLARK